MGSGIAQVAAMGGYTTLLYDVDAAMVGFVALFGMAARNTILLISHYDHLVNEEGETWSLAASMRGAEERLTPVLLTALLTALALLPVALQPEAPRERSYSDRDRVWVNRGLAVWPYQRLRWRRTRPWAFL